MSYEQIAKELRCYVALLHYKGSAARARLDEMLDNIDAIHASLEQENERLRDASERGVGWIRLPVDADGVPIHVGDELTDDADYEYPLEAEYLLGMLADELADCITACANLAYRYGIDMQTALDRCEQKNRERGRYDDGEEDA